MATHVKANANKKKHKDTIVKITENIYYDDLRKDINNDRLEHDKKEFDFDDDNEKPNDSNTAPCEDDLIKESNEDELIDTVEDEDGNAIIENMMLKLEK